MPTTHATGAALCSAPSLKYWRYSAALTQAQLAERAGVARSSIARLEHGDRAHATLVSQLAEALVNVLAEYAREVGETEDDERIDLTQPLTAEQRTSFGSP